MPGEIAKHLKEIFAQIKTVKRTGDNDEVVVFRLVRIIARIWHIHPFQEGNTRTTVIFAVLWARHLGFDVDHVLLKENAAYVRNALVWDSQGIYSKFEYLDASSATPFCTLMMKWNPRSKHRVNTRRLAIIA